MPDLKDFQSAVSNAPTYQHRTPDATVSMPKGAYIAIAFCMAGALPAFGSQFTPAAVAPTPYMLDGSTAAAALKNLALQNKAWFFGDGMVMGSAPMPTEGKESQLMGSRGELRSTREIKNTLDFKVLYSFYNTAFWNSMRAGDFGPLDIFVFTNKTIQEMRYEANVPVVHTIGSALGGDYEKQIDGGFKVSFTSETGELVPYAGVRLADLKFESLKYSFAAVTGTANIALVAGTVNRYRVTASGTVAKLTRAVVETGDLRYYIFKANGSAVEAATSINTDTGEITLLGTLTAGRYVYKIVAENNYGVSGSYLIEIIV